LLVSFVPFFTNNALNVGAIGLWSIFLEGLTGREFKNDLRTTDSLTILDG